MKRILDMIIIGSIIGVFIVIGMNVDEAGKTDLQKFQEDLVYAQVVKVIDGDTLDAKVTYQDTSSKIFRIRIINIDAPELKVNNKYTKDGNKSKYVLKDLLQDQYIVLRMQGEDKYNRTLAYIYFDVGEYMIKKNLAKRWLIN